MSLPHRRGNNAASIFSHQQFEEPARGTDQWRRDSTMSLVPEVWKHYPALWALASEENRDYLAAEVLRRFNGIVTDEKLVNLMVELGSTYYFNKYDVEVPPPSTRREMHDAVQTMNERILVQLGRDFEAQNSIVGKYYRDQHRSVAFAAGSRGGQWPGSDRRDDHSEQLY